MGAYPVRSIEAHNTKIYGIDWNRSEQNRIVTCSLDKSIKFWDCNNLEDVPERIINTPFPAWRARHTPFGFGLLAMPQRGNSDLHLYDRRPTNGHYVSDTVPPVARFEGHKGQVKEFLWRPRGTIVEGIDHRDFQLVTWGTDQELRLHRIVPETLGAVGYEKGVTQNSRLNFTRRNAKYRTFRSGPSEETFDEVFDSQAGSSPAAGQSFHPRPRGSTGVGMSKVVVPHSQGWLHGSNVTARLGMHGRTNSRQIMNPIDWMKNVKITSWGPETLGDEISQVGEKFAKVAFESVEMSQRKAVISMHAPWGPLSSPIFIKIDIKFPYAYPREAAAIFNVQKTAAMTDELAGMLSTELRTIAETYVARKRGCLEAVLRYLLREQDMEQIVSWILDEYLDDSKIVEDIGIGQDMSSDDDDDLDGRIFPGPTGTMPSELFNANVPVPKVCGALWADNGKLVCFFRPQPKPPTSFLDSLGSRINLGDESGKIFESFGRLQTDSPGARTTLRMVTSAEDQISDLSDDSSLSSSSSSGSSDNLVSSPTHFFTRDGWRAGGINLQRSRSADHSNQSALGLSQVQLGAEPPNSVVSMHDFSELLPFKRELAMEYIIFGRGPEVCGHNANVATKHGLEDIAHVWHLMELILWNEVPLEIISNLHSSSDVLTIARSASGLLKGDDSGVDLSYDKGMKRSRTDVPARIRWGESALGGKHLVTALMRHFEDLGDVQMLAMMTCVFAEPKVLNSFAVLSQHHHEFQMQLKAPAFSVDYHPSIEVARSVINKAPATSVTSSSAATRPRAPYHVASVEKAGNSNPITPYSTGTTPPSLAQHLSQPPLDRRRSSRLHTADVWDPSLRHSSSITHSGTASLSTSPEDSRSAHRSNSNLAFSLPRASLSALASSISHSPPNLSGGSGANKRPSPVGSFMGHHINPSGWSAASIFGGAGSGRGKIETGRPAARPQRSSARLVPSLLTAGPSRSMSSDGDGVDRAGVDSSSATTLNTRENGRTSLNLARRRGTRRKIKIQSTLHNQNMFDNDGYASVPLLDASLDWKYSAYRASYARLLGASGLHTQRAEVLKFDGLLGPSTPPSKDAASNPSCLDDDELALGNLLKLKTLHAKRNKIVQKRGLEIRRRCHDCCAMLEAVERNGVPIGWHCAECPVAECRKCTRSGCAICTKSIAGLMVPCLSCGHVICFECHRMWLARDNSNSNAIDDDDDQFDPADPPEITCPTGCGCTCSAHQFTTFSTSSPSDTSASAPPEDETLPSTASSTTSTISSISTSTPSPARTLTLTTPSPALPPPPQPPPPPNPENNSSTTTAAALTTFLSLSRTRSISSSSTTTSSSKRRPNNNSNPYDHRHTVVPPPPPTDAYSDAWAKYANMGKSLGAGLTRATSGLRERGGGVGGGGGGGGGARVGDDDAAPSVRRESEAEARLRRAGGRGAG